MSLRRTTLASLATVLAWAASGALAQAQMPCANDIIPLRQEVEKVGMTVKALIDRKADRGEICNGLKRFAVSEAKFVKYLETNGSWCGIPPDAIKQATAGHSNTLKMRGQACAAGPTARQGPPPGPGLSDALGTSRPPSVGNKNDRGTYNSLTGNPLQR